jgi:hypothetical protein
MKIEVFVTPGLLDEDPLCEEIAYLLARRMKDPNAKVTRVEVCTLEVDLDPEAVLKGVLQEVLDTYFDPDYSTDLEVGDVL